VSPEIFKQVYDSPHSLPGNHRWTTKEEDVRAIEKLLEIPETSIGAPLWVSGDTRHCPKSGRETNWLDIVSSALTKTTSGRRSAQLQTSQLGLPRKQIPTSSEKKP
jgi:hypothetical protein